MDSRARDLLFLLGIAPMALGCREPSSAGLDDETGDGSGGSGDTSTDGADGEDFCGPWAEARIACYYESNPPPGYLESLIGSCHSRQEFFQSYASPHCYAAWAVFTVCTTNSECPQWMHPCDDEFDEMSACYDNGGIYTGCTLYSHLVTECKGAAAGELADQQCEQTVNDLYGPWYYYSYTYAACGQAFYELMACISKLDCEALDDPALVEAGCGPELAEKEQECS